MTPQEFIQQYQEDKKTTGLVEMLGRLYDVVDDCETAEERLQMVKALLEHFDNDNVDGNELKTMQIISRGFSFNPIVSEAYDKCIERYNNLPYVIEHLKKFPKLKAKTSRELMERFSKGFKKGDIILETSARYISVENKGKIFVVGDNGERRERIVTDNGIKWYPALNKPALKGKLSFLEIREQQ